MNRAVLVSPRSDHGCNDPKDYKTNDNRQAVRIVAQAAPDAPATPAVTVAAKPTKKS